MLGMLHEKEKKSCPKETKSAYPSRFQLALRLSAGNEALPRTSSQGGCHLLGVINNCELLFHQFRGEVERLNCQVNQTQRLRQFINLFAQGLHLDGCHRFDFRAGIAVIEL